MNDLHAIIMAGGSGTRFWPASRRSRPKQLLPLAHGRCLIQATVERVLPLVGRERTWIVTNAAQAEDLGSAVPALPAEQVILEPQARDTAPCVALASAVIAARHPGATLAFMPADHLIAPVERFVALLRRAAELAAPGEDLVTFGIRPTHPAVGYGYIEKGPAIDDRQPAAFRALRFREKPDRATAGEFLASGRFVWNSGIFVWTLPALLAAMDAGNRELAAGTRAMLAAARGGSRQQLEDAFLSTPKTSVDFAVLERAPRVVVLEADLQWDDLGSFLTLGAVAPPDAAGNVALLHDGARVLLEDARGCVVYGEGAQAVALLGTRDLVVVVVGDAVLVCPKERAESLKEVVKSLSARGMEDLL